MPPIPNTAFGTLQTALSAGDAPIISVNVYSPYILSPEVSIDLSALGGPESTTTPASPGSPAFNSNSNYRFGPFTINASLTDGLKIVPITVVDFAGDTATGTAQIYFDNTVPTVSFSAITFSTTSPQGGDFMYLSGSVDGTGTVVKVAQLTLRLFDALGNPLVSPIIGTTIGYDPGEINTAIAPSGGGSFSEIPIQLLDFGDKNWYPRGETLEMEMLVYDEAGNFASTTLSVPLRPQQTGASNVLFLPGIESSRLYRPDGGGEAKLWEPGNDADALQLAMTTSGSSMRSDIYTRDVIDTAYIPLKGDVYKSFIADMNSLKADGVINDWEAVPYDWRLSLDEVLSNGAQIGQNISYLTPTSTPYIEQELRSLAATSKSGKVTIIAHSNGGLVAKSLIEKLGDATASALIDKIIFVAVPQVGTPKAIGSILHGFGQALPADWLPSALSPDAARTIAQNMPSAYNLLPSFQYFTQTDDPVIKFDNSQLLAPWRSRYGDVIHSSERLRTFLADAARPALPVAEEIKDPIVGNGTLFDDAEIVHDTDLDVWAPPSGIRMIEIAGWGIDTVKSIAYYQGTAGICTDRRSDSTCAAIVQTPVLDYRPEMVVDGDGTVVASSALWVSATERYWLNLRDYGEANFGSNIDRKHSDIFEVPQLRDFIKSILGPDSPNETLPDFISTDQPSGDSNDTRLHFILHSPLALDLYDDFGNHTGISTSTHSLEENIPGSYYEVLGGVTYVTIPASSAIHAFMQGTEEGSFTLEVEQVNGNIVTASSTFAGIPSTATTYATLTIPQDGEIANATPLTVDENNDGTVDFSITPLLNETATPFLYPWEGFLQPINDSAYQSSQKSSVFKSGSTIPVKFQLKGSDGTPVQASTAPQWLPPEKIGPMSSVVDEPIYSISGTGGTEYKWDETAQQYIYNWNTKGFAKGYWYEIYAKLDDGSTHSVVVGLR